MLDHDRDLEDIHLTPGTIVDVLANHYASLKSQLGVIDQHRASHALSGRKRYASERLAEVERIAKDLGNYVFDRVEARAETLLKD